MCCIDKDYDKDDLFKNILCLCNLCKRHNVVIIPINDGSGEENAETISRSNRIRGAIMANMEWGEEIAYIIAADVFTCLFLFTLSFEHIISVIGMTCLRD